MSSNLTFCAAVFLVASGTDSSSSLRPLVVLLFEARCHVVVSSRNGEKLASNDRQYSKLDFQFSNVLIDSVFVKHHCFGALCVAAIVNSSTCSQIGDQHCNSFTFDAHTLCCWRT